MAERAQLLSELFKIDLPRSQQHQSVLIVTKAPESGKLPLFENPRMRHEYQVPQDLSIILEEEQTLQLVHAEVKKRNQIVIEPPCR
jgi:hypothetical protein